MRTDPAWLPAPPGEPASEPVRVTGHGMPYPPAKLEGHYLPDLDRILDGVDRVLGRVEPFVPSSVPDAAAPVGAPGSRGATRTVEAVAR